MTTTTKESKTMNTIQLPENSITTATHQGHILTTGMATQLERTPQIKDVHALGRIRLDEELWVIGLHNETGDLTRVEFLPEPVPPIKDLPEAVTICPLFVQSGYAATTYQGRPIQFPMTTTQFCNAHPDGPRCLKNDWNGQEGNIEALLAEHDAYWQPFRDAARLPLIVLH